MCHLLLLLPVLALPVFWLWPLSIALPLYVATLVPSIAIYVLAMKTMRLPRVNGADGIVGRMGQVVRVDSRGITLQVGGEYWGADDDGDFEVGDQALVTGIDRLSLKVRKRAPVGARTDGGAPLA
jgi:membrane protein implicated in regulation of membrane protease activity